MKKITVVIPNFNGIQYVERCLDSLKRQTFSEFDVIFVDNGSVDGSRELTEEKYPWVRVIALAENTGFCKAVNIGIEATQTPYVVLLNNDTEAEPDFLLELYRGIERKKNAFSAAARMLQFHDRGKIDDAGNYYNCLGWAFALGKGKPEEKYKKERKIFASCGGAAIYRTELVKQLGGFDEDFFMYAEEEELSWRIKKRGEKIYNIPQAKIIHLEGATLEKQHDFNEKQFTFRINGTMTYFWKRYGREGIYQFYKFRALRYQRLKKIAEIQKKSDVSFQFETRLRCLLECFEKIMEKTEGEGKKNGRS